jgi:hypothetical protein
MSKVLWHVVVVGVLGAASVVAASDVQGVLSVDLAAPPEAAESASGPPAAVPPSTAERLRALTADERLNARFSLEGASSLGEIERQQARQVEGLWAEGRYDEAIAVLSRLEAGGARLAAAIAWREPVVSQAKSLFTDARIGGTRVGAQDVALDFDWATGNLFAVVQWADGSTVNISTDGGLSWAEKIFWSPTSRVDAAVVGQYLYVAHALVNGPEARMRRFFVADGELDTSYGTQSVANVSPNDILDVSLGTNADYNNNRIYLAFIESNNAVRCYWDVASDGTTFTEVSPVGVSAASGLDSHWGGGTMGSDPVFLWFSYLGTDGSIHVLGRANSATWTYDTISPDLYSSTSTRISAHGNNVFVAYTVQGTNTHAAGYHVSYDNGQTWDSGIPYDPPAGEPGCNGVDITARGGWGSAVVWNVEDAFDTVSLATREDYDPGPWNDPVAFNQFDAVSGAPSFIQYLRPQGAYGMVYFAGNSPADSIPYFDLIALMPFDDGFDFGDTSAWSDVVP